MTATEKQKSSSTDQMQIQTLIERWAKAVRDENREEIRADHDSDILMFDVPPPFLSRGIEAYMATWELFFSCSKKPVAFDFHDVNITAGQDVAFATRDRSMCKHHSRWRKGESGISIDHGLA